MSSGKLRMLITTNALAGGTSAPLHTDHTRICCEWAASPAVNQYRTVPARIFEALSQQAGDSAGVCTRRATECLQQLLCSHRHEHQRGAQATVGTS